MKISVREMAMVSMFAALACAGGLLLRFGGTGVVPYSILPFIVLLSGILLGGRLSALSMTIYLAIGLAGVPVFSSAPFGGLTYFVKPSAGFLFGYIAAAYVTGKIVEKTGKRSLLTFIPACMAGLAVLYAIGLPYFYVVMNYFAGNATDVLKVLKLGFLPFIGFDLIKACIASAMAVPIVNQVRAGRYSA